MVSFVLSSGRERKMPAPESHLRSLTRLRDDGVLTDAEFAEVVARLSRDL